VSFRSGVFDSDSEHEWLFLIQTSLSYDLNLTILKTSIRQNGVMVEAIGMTKGLYAVEKKGSVDDLLLSVLDETIKQVFREEGARAIYNYLENNSHLKLEETAEKPEVFSAGLERLLGSGAPVIEKLILKNLHRKLGLKFVEKKGYGFSDYIKGVEERCGC